ncbi:hypothetical protein [Robertkochia flava]|uniref:hypothetical protein n=1 Tax=Robertkochia flava TaxID=3447986 RepID=UPI001CCB321B|nr:hypothetical protein [Robertkochia marina]
MKRLIPYLFSLLPCTVFAQGIDLPDIPNPPGDEIPYLILRNQGFVTLDHNANPEMASIALFRVNLDSKHHKYRLKVFTEEYHNGVLVASDTLMNTLNTYSYFLEGKQRNGFINDLKFFTLKAENHCALEIRTLAMNIHKDLILEPEKPEEHFYLFPFGNTPWILNRKTPVLIFGSYRTENPKDHPSDQERLLETSAHYILVQYLMTEPEN